MKLSFKVFAAALLACGLLPRPALAHKFHESLAHLEYNKEARTVEMSFRLFSDDLEESLSRRAGRKVRLDKAQDTDALTLAYLQEAFELENRDGEAKRLRWVGMEIKVDVVWVYVEADMPEGLDEARLRNRIFFDLFDDQINRVNVKSGAALAFLVFKPGDQFKAVRNQR
ncbi:MAG TPA: DUF6702 family protein [Blastocatellia bacterium]|nr:DUF6702 family protein [Blastocatellia bacterium]